MVNIFHMLPQEAMQYVVCWGSFFCGFSAENKPILVSHTGFCSVSDSHCDIQKCLTDWNCTFHQIVLEYVIVIFRTMSMTQLGISIQHSANLFYKKLYSTPSHTLFFQKSRSSTLALAGALIWPITQPFLNTNISVWISPTCGCNSH